MFSKYAITAMKKALLPADKTLYLGLLQGTPDEYAGNVTELDYPAYERQAVMFDTVIDHNPTGNTSAAIFPQMDENLNGVSVGWYALYDAPTGGNLIEFGQMLQGGQPTVQPISPNNTVQIGVNGVLFGTVKNTPCTSAPCGSC